MNLTFRSMNSGEAPELKKLAQKAFGPIEGLFVTKPETALVAVYDEKPVGGFMYQIEMIGGRKIGFVSFLFTDPALQGQGIGKQLCGEGFRHLWEEGCDALVTFIRDDNVASWATFVKHGFVMASIPKMLSFFGLSELAKLYIKTKYGVFSIGHDFYIALRDEKSTSVFKKEGGPGQIIAYILINTLLFLPFILRAQSVLSVITSSAFIFFGIALAGYIGTVFSKQKWNFRFTSGGGLLYLAINAAPGIFFPLIGSWYPARYENTPVFRRDVAINVIAVWAFLLGITTADIFTGGFPLYLNYASQLATTLLVLKCLPVPVFESTGFGRVFKWNKLAFVLLASASIFIFVSPLF